MKESSGIGEGASPGQIKKQRNRVIRSRLLLATLVAAFVQAANIYYGEVKEYKQIKETLKIEVDRGSDGTIDDEARTVEDRTRFAWVPSRVSLLKYAASLIAPNTAHALIVNTGENWLVDAFQNLVEPETMIYTASGTGTVAAAEGDVGLGAEITTGLNPDSTRPSCTVVGEGASPNIRRCQATVSYDATLAVTEWGLCNQASTAACPALFTRIVFSAVNVNSGDSIQFTYDLTVE